MIQREDNTTKRVFNSYFFLLALLIIATMVAFTYARTYYYDYQVKQEIVSLQEQANQLQTKKIELIEELSYVKSDSYVEGVAKTELNLAKNGEKIMMIKNSSSTASGSYGQVDKPVVKLESNNYNKWLKFFLTD